MAKLSAHGAELVRYFSVQRRALISCRADGVRLYRSLHSGGWKVLSRKKPAVSLADWSKSKLDYVATLPVWARECKSLPSEASLREWSMDSVCETLSGDTVEPDGYGSDGAPSWLIALGMI
jgi:hypothetical protein